MSIETGIEKGFTQELIDVGVLENVVYEENSISITGYDATCPKDIVIPKTINGKQVTEIGDYAFTTNKEFNIGQMINEIKDHNKANMNYVKNDSYQIIPCPVLIDGIGVTSVVLPEGLKKIGYMSFAGNDLTELNIPSSLTYIGDGAFVNNQITNINFSTTPLTAKCDSFAINPITESEYTYPDNVTISCVVPT